MVAELKQEYLVDKPGKSDILNVKEKKPCEITVLYSDGFFERNSYTKLTYVQ